MDPTELNDARPLHPPIALWREMVVSSIHHDQYCDVSWEEQQMAERMVLDLIDRMEGEGLMPSVADASMRATWERRPGRSC